MAAIPILWLLSLHGTSYFVDRYLIPSLVGAALLQCAALERHIPLGHRGWVTGSLWIAASMMAGASGYSFFADMPHFAEPPHAYTDSMVSQVPPQLPVVVERVDVFAEALAAHPDIQWRYLLDWDTAMLPESPRGDVSGYHEMERWRRVGYHADAIQPSSEFLSRQSDFWVISDPSELWFARRVQSNPIFQTRRIGSFSREGQIESVWMIHRLHQAQ